MNDCSDHPVEVRRQLEVLRSDERLMLQTGKHLLGAPGAPFFPLDLLAYAALKRNLSSSSAIILLVENFNLLAARSMLRVHIDTALRFAAAWHVHSPHEFASAVYGGERIDKIKDSEGKRLTDARLVELLSPQHPWLSAVYENLSGYIHFSSSHVAASVTSLNDETGEISFLFGKRDEHYLPFSWVEMLECAHEATGILNCYFLGYIQTKAMSPEELAASRK